MFSFYLMAYTLSNESDVRQNGGGCFLLLFFFNQTFVVPFRNTEQCALRQTQLYYDYLDTYTN